MSIESDLEQIISKTCCFGFTAYSDSKIYKHCPIAILKGFSSCRDCNVLGISVQKSGEEASKILSNMEKLKLWDAL